MADNIEEEPLDNQTSSQSENPSTEIIIKETKTAEPNQETENMEVHHHPDLHHKPKKWKEYFLEFLMIFLAVTLGFFAENIREKTVSKERELHYMESIVADLKQDTSELNSIFLKQKYLVSEMDSALKIPVEKLQDINSQDTFYYHYIYFYSLLSIFKPHDNTLSQLKNAGGFSVIRNADVLDSIGKLNLLYQINLSVDNDYYNQFYSRVLDIGSQVMKCPDFIINLDGSNLKIQKDSEVFINYNRLLLQQLYSYIHMEKGQILQCIDRQEQYEDKAIRLIKFINRKYNLE